MGAAVPVSCVLNSVSYFKSISSVTVILVTAAVFHASVNSAALVTVTCPAISNKDMSRLVLLVLASSSDSASVVFLLLLSIFVSEDSVCASFIASFTVSSDAMTFCSSRTDVAIELVAFTSSAATIIIGEIKIFISNIDRHIDILIFMLSFLSCILMFKFSFDNNIISQ